MPKYVTVRLAQGGQRMVDIATADVADFRVGMLPIAPCYNTGLRSDIEKAMGCFPHLGKIYRLSDGFAFVEARANIGAEPEFFELGPIHREELLRIYGADAETRREWVMGNATPGNPPAESEQADPKRPAKPTPKRRGRKQGINYINLALTELTARMKDDRPIGIPDLARAVGCTCENLNQSKRFTKQYRLLTRALDRVPRGRKDGGRIEAEDVDVPNI